MFVTAFQNLFHKEVPVSSYSLFLSRHMCTVYGTISMYIVLYSYDIYIYVRWKGKVECESLYFQGAEVFLPPLGFRG